jgi:hypothetical protein
MASVFLIVFFLAVFFSISPMSWLALFAVCGAVWVAVAKSNIQPAAKLKTAAGYSFGVVVLFISAHVGWYWEQEIGGPHRQREAVRVAQLEIDRLLASTSAQRFSKALAMAQVFQSAKSAGQNHHMTLAIHQALDALNGSIPLAESEIAVALSVAHAVNICPDFVPAVLARQIALADLHSTLQSWPNRPDCAGADLRLVQRIIERCERQLAGRCPNELPLAALLLESDLRYAPDSRYPGQVVGERTPRAKALRQLIALVWPQQKLSD